MTTGEQVQPAAPALLAWSEFASFAADTIWRKSGTWPEFIEHIKTAAGYRNKAACPWVKLAVFGDSRTAKKSLRHDDNLLTISGVEGDYDGEVMQPEEAITKLERAHIKAIVYTSPSHTAAKPRWRVLAPCSSGRPREARSALLARVNGVLGGVLSNESFTLSQSYYFGQVNGADYRVLVTFDDSGEGFYVDELDELDELAIGRPAAGGAGARAGDTGAEWVRPGEDVFAAAVQRLGRKLRSGDGRRELLKSYITSRSARGLRADDIAVLVDGIAARYFDPADPPTKSNIGAIVEWATGRDGAVQQQAADVRAMIIAGDDDTTVLEPPDFSDDRLALDFVEAYGAGHRWTPGLGWMIDTGIVWKRDDALARYDLARRVCRAAAAGANKIEEQKRLTSAKTVNAVLSLAQSDQNIVVPAAAWDGEPMLLNTPRGVVDLRTGGPRDRCADDFVTQAARVAPDFDGNAEVFERFMQDIFAGDHEIIDFMQRALGYCLTGDRREQVLFFWHGTGANGKSTLLDLVQWMLDTYALKLPAAALMVSRNERHPTELAQLRGKRMAISSELEEGQFWNEALIKELTGDAVLTARFMRQDFFEFPMTQKHIIVGNHKPRLRGGDPAIARRLVLVPFEVKFEGQRRDVRLPEKLREEAPAILAWIIRGAVRWHRDGLLVPRRVREAGADYLADHDDLALWMEECCTRPLIACEVKASTLYASFKQWKQRRGEFPPSQTAWGQRLQAVPGVSRRRSNGMKYVGIQLTDEEARRAQYAA